jgi:hypothetical protein
MPRRSDDRRRAAAAEAPPVWWQQAPSAGYPTYTDSGQVGPWPVPGSDSRLYRSDGNVQPWLGDPPLGPALAEPHGLNGSSAAHFVPAAQTPATETGPPLTAFPTGRWYAAPGGDSAGTDLWILDTHSAAPPLARTQVAIRQPEPSTGLGNAAVRPADSPSSTGRPQPNVEAVRCG